jgi:hypothetical protein
MERRILSFLIKFIQNTNKKKKGIKVYFLFFFNVKGLNISILFKFYIYGVFCYVKCACALFKGGYVEYFYIARGQTISYLFIVDKIVKILNEKNA